MRTSPLAVNGSTIRALREAHGWDIKTFAEAVEASDSFMSRIECGYRQPNAKLRLAIAKQLGVPLGAITKNPLPDVVAAKLADVEVYRNGRGA